MNQKKTDPITSDWKEIWSRITDEKPSEVVKMLKEAREGKAS